MVNVEYVACCMCGKTVAKNKFKAEPFKIDPLDFRLLQVREQKGGRAGQGFFNIPEEGKNIRDLWNGSSEEKEIAQTFKDRLLAVVKAYMSAGIISKEEIIV